MADEVVVDWPHRLLEPGRADTRPSRRRVRADPRPQVRRARHRRRARDRRRLPRRHGSAGGPTTSGPSGCAKEGVDDAGLGRVHGAHRARHRRPHARGDGGVDLRRDHRPAHRASTRRLVPRHRAARSTRVTIAAVRGWRPAAARRFVGADTQVARGLPGQTGRAMGRRERGRRQISTITSSSRCGRSPPRPPRRRHCSAQPRWHHGQATSLQAAAVAWPDATAYDAIVVGLGDQPLVPAATWRRRLGGASGRGRWCRPADGRSAQQLRCARPRVWPLLPTDGDEGARVLIAERPDLVAEVACPGARSTSTPWRICRRWS